MTIIQELKEGTKRFKVNEDGTEEVFLYPPNSKELRAARRLEELHNIIKGLATSIESNKAQLIGIMQANAQYQEIIKSLEDKLKAETKEENHDL